MAVNVKKVIAVVSGGVRAWHGSDVAITRFDWEYSAQGVFWFTTDLDKIRRGESGASSSKYIIEVWLNISNPAGWREYEKLGLGQIKDAGFDSIELDDDVVVFDEDKIEIVSVTRAEDL